ncbi:CLUMA_CG004553, isoform A [Clunio marinus]|uniref:CLUMA_CG004553, isoform A n=1 Tax=Clunio marinus TaxID=568069 RepID=A0A1J1HS32_9DIPT|nr:CLUMA_CG004553, isoform A [Clunio marinus]
MMLSSANDSKDKPCAFKETPKSAKHKNNAFEGDKNAFYCFLSHKSSTFISSSLFNMHLCVKECFLLFLPSFRLLKSHESNLETINHKKTKRKTENER